MNQLSLNAIAILVALMTGSVLLGPYIHLPQEIPAALTLGILALATLDAVTFNSRGTTLMLDWFAQRSPQHRQRVIHHEAGHFLTARLLDLPVTGYSLSAWEAFRQGHPGQGGVQITVPDIAIAQLPTTTLNHYCTVWMAGSVAESLKYDDIVGGEDDRQTLRQTLRALNLDIPQRERQASRTARRLLEDHWPLYEQLVTAMTERQSVSECCELIAPLANSKSV